MTTKDIERIRRRIRDSRAKRYVHHDTRSFQRRLEERGESLYSRDELERLGAAGVSERLPPRATAHYLRLASRSEALTNLIKARPEETEDLSGQRDPSNQLRYSPVPGVLHKYELILLYVVRTCSSFCRYCYRSDFLTGKTEKDVAEIEPVARYVREHNAREPWVEEHVPIREALLSGGDPLVLSNRRLFDWLHGLAQAGIQTIRIGTKELAFFPQRFDDAFFATLDAFHDLHPHVNLPFMVHFSHPHELIELDARGEWARDEHGAPRRIAAVERAVRRLRQRPWIGLENQAPIIDGVNDDPDVLRSLQIELKRLGINCYYFFQCREIEGHRVFAVPVERAWRIHTESQGGLSGIERSRFAMSTEAGKLEVVSVLARPDLHRFADRLDPGLVETIDRLVGDGLVVFKLHRTPSLSKQSDLIVARRNPEALWISGYEDRLLYDGRRGVLRQYAPLLEALLEDGDAGGRPQAGQARFRYHDGA